MIARALLAACCCCLLFLVPGTLRAQKIENLKVSFQSGKVTITYDLTGYRQGQKYSLEVFGSHNNYTSALRMVTGAVGKNVNGGLNLTIEWNAADELGNYNGEISFKLKGEPVITSFSFLNPAEGGSVRRGKTSEIKWAGGESDQKVTLEVVQGGRVVQSITQGTSNTGTFAWQVPSDFVKGDYNLRLMSSSTTVQSGTFKVKAKVPLIVKISPLIVGGLIVVLLPKDDDDPPVTGAEDLPNAPIPN